MGENTDQKNFKYGLFLRSADSCTISDNDNLEIPGHNAVRTDLLLNPKIGGASIYYKNSLPLKVPDIY